MECSCLAANIWLQFSIRRFFMGSRGNMYCWEIMQCENSDDCPARKNPSKQCWEIASDLDDYRSANNICRDCIVYVLKADKSILSPQEIDTIIEHKIRCKMVHRYPRLAAWAFCLPDVYCEKIMRDYWKAAIHSDMLSHLDEYLSLHLRRGIFL